MLHLQHPSFSFGRFNPPLSVREQLLDRRRY